MPSCGKINFHSNSKPTCLHCVHCTSNRLADDKHAMLYNLNMKSTHNESSGHMAKSKQSAKVYLDDGRHLKKQHYYPVGFSSVMSVPLSIVSVTVTIDHRLFGLKPSCYMIVPWYFVPSFFNSRPLMHNIQNHKLVKFFKYTLCISLI